MRVHGLIIDPQQDFCSPTGSLYVPGADQDMVRLAGLIGRLGTAIEAIHVTLDSHHSVDIAHPIWWQNPAGEQPAPFTIITPEDIDAGRWQAANPTARERSAQYVHQLAGNGRYPLCIWPYHCLIGGPGHNIASDLHQVLQDWEMASLTPVDYVFKGSNIWTEHYSALRADVPDANDPATQPNDRLIQHLLGADLIFVAGEAGSHCVANTVRDLVQMTGGQELGQKIVLLTDALSPVSGFEELQEVFLQKMQAQGVKTATTGDFLL